jgi:primosomal protein N' (replication factor Y)
VLVQTLNPDHPAILAAVRHDYQAFATGELPIRQMLSYPPFASKIRLVVRGPAEEATGQFAGHLAERLTAALTTCQARVLGPAPAPFAKLRGKYRFQIQLQGPDGDKLRAAVAAVTGDLNPPEEIQWIVDVDPLDML